MSEKNLLKEKYNNYAFVRKASVSRILLGLFIIIMSLILFFVLYDTELKNRSYYLLAINAIFLFSGIFVLISGNRIEYNRKDANILKSGIVGENKTMEILSMLPDDYYGFQNVTIKFEGRKSELDMVIVGKTGVFIIETKNHTGLIRGDYSEHDWLQYKIGRNGTPYNSNFYNPVKQVGTHIYRLANFLRTKKINVHITGIVYFSNEEATVHVSGSKDDMYVFSESDNGQKQMLSCILNNNDNLNEKTIQRISQILNRDL